MTTGIYKIENLLNGKIYIGQSIHIEKRWLEHCQNNNKKSLIKMAIQEFGKENFSFQILEECSQELLNERETFYIKEYNSLYPNGYNRALNNNGTNEFFINYSYDTLQEVVNDIKKSSLTFSEIANKYDLDLSTIYYLNRGDYHTQLNETYPLRQVKDFSKKHFYCVDCGVEISFGSVRCVKCEHIKQRVCERPDRETFKKLIRTESFVSLGKMFGVSDKAICKWCVAYGLPKTKKEIKSFNEEEWQKI